MGSWTTVTGDVCSGRVTSIAIDPNTPQTIYLGSAGGGVWKTTDGGLSWIPLTDDQSVSAVGSIAVNQNGVIYAGTGEGNNGNDNGFGVGILKSTDGGNTWTTLGTSTFDGSTITKIAVNPNDPNTILAATNAGGGVYGGTTVAYNTNYQEPSGIYISTDGGNSWTGTLVATQQVCGSYRCEASDVIFDPHNPSTVFAAFAGGIYRSDDGGSTWRWLTGTLGTAAGDVYPVPGRISLAISGNSLFAVGDISAGGNANPPDYGGLIESTDGGNSWTNIKTPSTSDFPNFCVSEAGSQCWYDLYVAVDPTNSNILYLGGQDLWRTTDAGNTWTDIGGYAGGIHPDQHAFAFSPLSSDHIYVGNDGGIWYSEDASSCDVSNCWVNLNSGLVITQVTSLAVHPTDPSIVYGGAQDNSEWELSDSGVWSMLDSGDAGWVAFDLNNPLTLYHTYYRDVIARSDNGGSIDGWQEITNGISPDDPSEWYVPVAMDPSNPTTLYLGTYRLYKTTDAGDQWTATAALQRPTDCMSGECLTAIAVAPSDGTHVYVGTNSGRVFASTDGGNTFSDVSQGLPSVAVTKIVVDQSNPNKVYAGFLNISGSNIMTSSDGGASWSDISSNLPSLPITALTVDQSGAIYVGTIAGGGVYVSTDGATWSILGSGLPTATVRDLVFSANGTLMAATYGRGIWSIVVPTATSVPSISQQTESSHYPALPTPSSSNVKILHERKFAITQLVNYVCKRFYPQEFKNGWRGYWPAPKP